MNQLEYSIAPEIFAAHPSYVRGVVLFASVDNRGSDAALAEQLREVEKQVRESVLGNVAELPQVAAWRNAYRSFGAKPSEHRSSIEAMLRRVVKPDRLPSINPLVDIGNLVSLKYLLPAGVHPLAGGHDVLELREANADDTFVPAGTGSLEVPSEREIVFASGHDVLTRRWTWRQAAGTQTLPETSRGFFNVDGLAPITREEVAMAMQEIVLLIRKFCGVSAKESAILDVVRPSMAIEY